MQCTYSAYILYAVYTECIGSVYVISTQVQSLGGKDPLEKGMTTHSSILAWKITWTEEPGGLHTVHGVAESGTTE